MLVISSIGVSAAQDSGSSTINGVTCEYELYATSAYAQANSWAYGDVVVGTIQMWGVLRDNLYGGTVSFTNGDCSHSSDGSGHRRAHITASEVSASVVSAYTYHYFGSKTFYLNVRV